MEQENFFKTKKVTGFFAILSLVGGFLFLNKSITGNVLLTNEPAFNLIELLGLILIICAIILGSYTVLKK